MTSPKKEANFEQPPMISLWRLSILWHTFIYLPTFQPSKKFFNDEMTPLAKLASAMFCLSGVFFSHLPRCVYKGPGNDRIHRHVPFWHPIYVDFLMRPPVHDTNDWDISGRHRAFQSNLTTLIRINWHLIKIFVLESNMCLCSLRDRFPSDRC